MTKSLQQLVIEAYQGKIFKGVAASERIATGYQKLREKQYGQKIEWVSVGAENDEINIRFGMQDGQCFNFNYDEEITVE